MIRLSPAMNTCRRRLTRALCVALCACAIVGCKRSPSRANAPVASVPPSVPASPAAAASGPVFTDEQKAEQRASAGRLLSSLAQSMGRREKSFVIAPGDYRFDRERGFALRRLENVEIEATGATFWFGSGQGVGIESCRNLRLRGLTIDSDPLPWTQAVIEEIDPAAQTMVVRVEADYEVPAGEKLAKPCRVLFFDGETRLELPVFDDQATSIEPLGDRRLKITKFASSRVFRNPVPGRPVCAGDLVALFIMYGGGANISLRDCEAVRLENITNHAASAFAYHETKGKGGNQYIGCKLTRRPGTTRLMASRADCFHSYLMEKGPLIENCEFSHSGDDLINIHGFFGLVLQVSSPRECIVASPYGAIMGAGSALRIADPEAKTEPREANVVSAEALRDPAAMAEAKALPESLTRDRQLRVRDMSDVCLVRVVLDREVPLQKYDLVSGPDYAGRGAVLRGNHLHDGHVRGILLKSHDVVVEDNRIERTGHGGIVLEPEFFWLEGPFCRNIRVQNNKLVENGRASFDLAGFGVSHAAIQVGVTFGKRMFPRTLVSGIMNEDIRITGNRIERPAGFGIMVMNTRRAVITGNAIVGAFAAGPMPAFYDFSNLPDDASALGAEERERLKRPQDAIFVYRSEDITLGDNSVGQAP